MEDTKRTQRITIILGVIIVALLGFAFWYLFLSRGPGDTLPPITGEGGFGGEGGVGERPNGTTGGEVGLPFIPPQTTDTDGPIFIQLTNVPVAGLYALETRTGVRYVEREKGDVYEISDIDPSTRRKIAVNMVPGVHEAFFGNGGATVILRYMDFTQNNLGRISTILGRIPPSEDTATPVAVENTQLVQDITDISISPDGTKLAFIVSLPNEGSSIRVMDLVDRKPEEILRSPLKEWIPYIMDNGDVFLATKASVYAPGYLYRYSRSSKTFERIIRGKMGMTALPSPDGEIALYSETVSGSPVFGIAGVQTGELGEIVGTESPLSLTSLAEKCVWHQDGKTAYCSSFALPSSSRYLIPDSWYQGDVGLEDTFWSIDRDTLETTLLADPEADVGKTFDVLRLVVSPDRSTIYFIDRNDGTLWALRLPRSTLTTPGISIEPTPEELRDIEGSTGI